MNNTENEKPHETEYYSLVQLLFDMDKKKRLSIIFVFIFSILALIALKVITTEFNPVTYQNKAMTAEVLEHEKLSLFRRYTLKINVDGNVEKINDYDLYYIAQDREIIELYLVTEYNKNGEIVGQYYSTKKKDNV